MKKTLFSLGLCLMLSQPAVAAFQSANGLLSRCNSQDNAQFALCAEYLKATVDTLEALDSSDNLKGKKYCGLDRATVGQLVEAFVSAANARPEKLSHGASGMVLSGFDTAFYCKK